MLTLEQMTPEQKIGRVLCFRRVHVAEDLEFTLEMIRNEAVGCIQVAHTPEAPALIKKLRAAASYPVLIVNDMETGYPESSLPHIPTISLAATGNPEYVRLFSAAIAKQAKADGWSGAWSPVVDILTNPEEQLSTHRIAGDAPEAVTDFAREMLTAFNSYRFQGSAKHYPGGHDSGTDTHMTDGISEADEERLLKVDLVPYLKMMEEGLLKAIMVDHGYYPKIDPDYPASLSKKVIGVLRRAGFDGLVYTDSLAMMALLQKFGEEQAMILALNAGNDIVLPNYRTPSREAYDTMVKAYYDGRIDKERLDEAVRHVMEAEAWCAEEVTDPIPVPENIEEILCNVARDCITAECAEGVGAAVDPEERRLFVVLTQMGFELDGPAMEIGTKQFYYPQTIADGIRERFPNAEVVTLPEFPTSQQNDRALTAATKHDKVVFVTFCQTGCYTGVDRLTRRVESVISAIHTAGKIEAIVHFGNPLAMRELPTMDRYIFGYHSAASQLPALDVLAGKYPAKGRMPFPSFAKK